MNTIVDYNLEATIINVQKFTVHDGPGIRTELFFKGCPLHCKWCSNPESINPRPEVGVYGSSCIGVAQCGWCLSACPQHKAGKVTLVEEGGRIVRIDRSNCIGCLSCAAHCPNDTLKAYGQRITVREALRLVSQDRNYYKYSGGGVTVSGGDPMLQWEFVREFFKGCQKLSIHTCMESELVCKTEALDEVLAYTNLLITDIKHMDSAMHREYTGVGNTLILKNIRFAAMKSVDMVVRIPIIPNFNDSEGNLRATATFLKENVGGALKQLQLLPYRLLGLEKYESLGLEYPMKGSEPPERAVYEANIRRIAAMLKEMGVPAVPGTNQKL